MRLCARIGCWRYLERRQRMWCSVRCRMRARWPVIKVQQDTYVRLVEIAEQRGVSLAAVIDGL